MTNSKLEIRNPKQLRNQNVPKSKPFDLEERTYLFANEVRLFVKLLPKTATNFQDIKQLSRSSGSVGANYIGANEVLTKKDFKHRLRIAKKEAKETMYWLRLLDTGNDEKLDAQRGQLINETRELMNILGAILTKAK